MQKIKDKSKKIKVNQLQTNINIFYVKLIFTITFHNVLNLPDSYRESLSFYLLSFLKSRN